MDERLVPFTTELKYLVLFDPAVLKHRVREPRSWWHSQALSTIPEVLDGRVGIFPIGLDGDYRVRLSATGLRDDEQRYARESLSGFLVKVESGRLFLGPAERMPGDGAGEKLAIIPGKGAALRVPEGLYRLRIEALDWRYDDDFYKANGDVKDSAPADWVLHLSRIEDGEVEHTSATIPDSWPSLRELRKRPEVKVAAPSAMTVASSAKAPSSGRKSSRRAAPAPSPSLPPHVRKLMGMLCAEDQLSHHLGQDQAFVLDRGEYVLTPENKSLKAHSWDLDELYKKITRVREQLRVLEQKVNSSKLSVFDKVELEAGITGVYEALMHLTRFDHELLTENSAVSPAQTPAQPKAGDDQ